MQVGARIDRAPPRMRSASSSGRGSAAWRALRRLIGAEAREGEPVAAVAGRHHAVEHVDAARDRFEQILRRADAHQVARPIGRQHRRDLVDDARASRPAARRPRARRSHSRESRCRRAPARFRCRSAGSSPPCTMPNSARPGAAPSNARLQRSAQREREPHRALDLRRRVAGSFRHSSSCITMSAPSSVLDLDRALGRERDHRAVEVRAEGHARVSSSLRRLRRATSPGSRRNR